MASSIIDVLVEEAREARTGDEYFFKQMPWIFRIVCEGKQFVGPCGPDGTAVFPLPINPERFNYTLPFATNLTPQQESGVVVERGGVVIGDINLTASMGWKLRQNRAIMWGAPAANFTSQLGLLDNKFDEISGQMAFWLLANRCFEGYSELVQDPETADKTRMELHILKDQLHLEVEPVNIVLRRDAAKERVTYRYDITLKVIGGAEPYDFVIPDEKNWLDKVADTISTIRETAQGIAAAVDDVTAALDDLSRLASSVTDIVGDLNTVVDAANNLATGVSDFFNLPNEFLTNLTDSVASLADAYAEISSLPMDVAQTFRQIEDNLDAMKVAVRDHLRQEWRGSSMAYNKKTEGSPKAPANTSDEDQVLIDATASEAIAGGGTQTADQVFSSKYRPGDVKRQGLATVQQRLRDEYSGFSERTIGQGDTLQSLAAKHMGDSSKWLDLAIVNRLKPPYITNGAKLPGTLQLGSPITIPISKPNRPVGVLTTGDDLGRSQAEINLGTDFELVQIEKGRYGWKVDTDHGATDGVKVVGVQNLGQGLKSRLDTNRGEDFLFPNVGIPRVIGQKFWQDTRSEAHLRFRQQILADPRVERLLSYSLSNVNDVLEVQMTVQPVGFSTARVINRTLS